MSQKQENYNNHDIRIGAFASVTLDLKVNCNYVISCIKKVNNSEEDFYEKELGKMISYIENLTCQESENFWERFNYHLCNEDWQPYSFTVDNEYNVECVSESGMVGEEAEYYLFKEVIEYCCEDIEYCCEDNCECDI